MARWNNRPTPAAPWQPREGRLPGSRLSYLEAGSGPPLVFLHGWAAFKEIWWGSMHAVAPRYRAIALDWPGHGASPPQTQPARLDDLARLAADSCRELGLPPVTVVGHSMGGRVAAQLALDEPTLVARLVLVDAALDPAHIAPSTRRLLALREIERTVALGRRIGRGFGPLRPAEHGHRGGFVRPFLRRSFYNGLADPRSLHEYLRSLHAAGLDARLSEIQQPSLVVSGARDPLISPRQARRAAALIPHAALRLIPGALHTPMDDRPAAFHRILLDFLARTDA